jgi:hypothetical protein
MRDPLADLLDDASDVGTENEGVALDEEVVFANLRTTHEGTAR